MEPTLFFRTSYFVFCSKRFANILYFIERTNVFKKNKKYFFVNI